MNRLLLAILPGALLSFLAGCSTPTDVADGSSSETVIGRALNENGTPVSGARVSLTPNDLSPFDTTRDNYILVTTSDAEGSYTFPTPDAGTYHIAALDPPNMTRALVVYRETGSGSSQVDDAILRAPGTIRILLPDSTDTLSYCYLAGTALHSYAIVRTDGMAYVEIDSVAQAGVYSARLAGAGWQAGSEVTIDGAAARSGDVTVYLAPGTTWARSTTLTLNTTSTGANVNQTVAGYPLLVRLDSSNFTFADAAGNGEDLQFLSPHNRMLPCEVERWDSAQGLAEIWVGVDTVAGNGLTEITMMWGRGSVAGIAGSAWVFDTSEGFAGVWHLGEEAPGKGTADLYRDATPNGFHGTDYLGATGREGIVGYGHEFGGDADSDWVDLGRDRAFLNDVTGATLEAWVKLDSTPAFWYFLTHSVGAPTDADSSRAILFSNSYGFASVGGRSTDTEASKGTADSDTLTAGQWYHIVGILDYENDSMSVYVDGAHRATHYEDFPAPRTPSTPSQYSAMGASDRGDTKYFDGVLDEVRTHRTVRSAAWIRLSYENQKPDQTLVEMP